MASTTRRRSTRSSVKKKGGTEFYPHYLIGMGANKQVFSVTSNIDAKTVVKPILTSEDREKMPIIIDESDSQNVVMVRPKNSLNSYDAGQFGEEMRLQSRFSELGLAPKVLKINTDLKNHEGYTPYAYTNRCYFNICDYEFKAIQKGLKSLFDAVAAEGYIYTDIKQGNTCIMNDDGRGRTKNPKFVFVDFDQDYIYHYRGFNVTNSGNEAYVDTEEIVSDIMEFIFIIIEMKFCGKRLNCLFCKNLTDMAERLVELKDKYDNFRLNTYPMISETGNTLMELLGSDIPRVNPAELLAAYLELDLDPYDYTATMVYNSVMETLNSVLNREIKTKSRSKSKSNSNSNSKTRSKSNSKTKSKSKSKSPSKTFKKYTPNPIDSPSAKEMTPSGAVRYAWKMRK